MKLSVVVPVYNSESIVAKTIQRTCDVLDMQEIDYEIIAVNDGSSDNSWFLIREGAKRRAPVIAVNLLKNYGQHTAVLCGLCLSRGDYVATIDDDSVLLTTKK